jgi:hypothetical protein
MANDKKYLRFVQTYYDNMRCQNAFGDFDIVTVHLPDERDKEPDNIFGCVSSAINWKDVNSFNVHDRVALCTT